MVPPAEDSVGANSKEKLFMARLFVRETFFVILVSIIALTSRFSDFHLCNLRGVLSHQNVYLGNMHLYEIRPVIYLH